MFDSGGADRRGAERAECGRAQAAVTDASPADAVVTDASPADAVVLDVARAGTAVTDAGSAEAAVTARAATDASRASAASPGASGTTADDAPDEDRPHVDVPRAWVDRHPEAARLEALAPGSALVGVLEGLEVADLDGAALVEGIAGWERVAGWVVARQGLLVAELARRARGVEMDLVPDEVASRLVTTRRSAERTCDLALALDRAPAVQAALEAGVIDARKARVIVEGTEHLPASLAPEVQAEALQQAPGLTAPQLSAVIRRAEISLDAQGAERRHTRARAQRCVQMRPAPDAMAWIHALLPAPDAMTVITAVDALAAAADPQDPRGIDARRADALVDVLRQVLDTGIGPTGPLPTTQRRRPHLHITVNPTAVQSLSHPTADHQPGADQPAAGPPGSHATDSRPEDYQPAALQSAPPQAGAYAYLAGYGPVPARVIHEIAREASWRAVAADPRTGELAVRSTTAYRPSAALAGLVIDRDTTCTFPGCRVPAHRCDLDHIVAFTPHRPAEQQTTTENLHTLCRHHHRLKTTGHWTPVRDPHTGVTTWTSPTGHTYTRDPVPLDPLHRLTRPPRPTTHADDPAALTWDNTVPVDDLAALTWDNTVPVDDPAALAANDVEPGDAADAERDRPAPGPGDAQQDAGGVPTEPADEVSRGACGADPVHSCDEPRVESEGQPVESEGRPVESEGHPVESLPSPRDDQLGPPPF